MIETERKFKTGLELADALALDVADWITSAIAEHDYAVLAVSGGTTPQQFFASLSKIHLDWAKVQITLVDERQVDETNPRSNAKLVKDCLMQNEVAAAQFVPLYQNPNAANLSRFSVAILGMGNDGHTASFFPGGNHLKEALDVSQSHSIIAMTAAGAGEPRLTFTLPRLLAAKHLCLHIEGNDKQAVLQKALAGEDQFEMPIRAVLNAAKPLSIYWCP